MNRIGLRAFLGIATAALAVMLTMIIVQPTLTGAQLKPGDTAETTYRSPRRVTYQSDLRTKEAQDQAANAVQPTYRNDPTAPAQQDAKTIATFNAISGIRAAPGTEDRVNRLIRILPNSTAADANRLLGLDDPAWMNVQNVLRAAIVKAQTTQVKPDDLNRAEAIVSAQLPELAPDQRDAALIIGRKVLIPNYVADEEATEASRQRARDTVQPINYTVERDQTIVYRGQQVTDFDIERLQAVGLTKPAFSLQRTLGIFLLAWLAAGVLLLVAPRYEEGPRHLRRLVLLLIGFAVVVAIGGIAVVPAQPILAYVFPVAAVALLLQIFYGFVTAAISGIAISAIYALAAGGSFELFFIHLAASVAALIVGRRIGSIVRFIQAGAVVAVVVFIGMTAFGLLAANFTAGSFPKFAIAAALNGTLTTTFVFAGTAFLGSLLGRVTFLQLLELESPRQELLRKLATEAPGTYSHSLRMAGLVENVAAQIGADPLLARVQTLYHDIGKTSAPEYFVENQRGFNPHTELTPRESADILRSHISEGLTLAAEYRLPDEVAAAIPEHHGTSLMGYFWGAAQKGRKKVSESDFRYLGPKPQSKETAIIMLADSVEAASRTLDNPDEKAIRKLIWQLFADRVADGQLDEAPLSTRELTVLKEAFAQAIINDLHKRIRYPGK